jgi:hypothetical protein
MLEKEGEMLTTNLDRLRCGGEQRVQQTHRQEQSNARRERVERNKKEEKTRLLTYFGWAFLEEKKILPA